MLTGRDDGSLSLLMIGYALIAAVLVVVGVDVSKVFLAQRALSSAADAAALAAAQQVDRAAIYTGSSSCDDLPVDPTTAADAANASLDDATPGLRQALADLSAPAFAFNAGTVTVQLRGTVALPFGRVAALLLSNRSDGRVAVTASASAQTSTTDAPRC